MSPDEIAARIRGRSSDVVVARGEVNILVPREELREALSFLREDADLRLDFLASVTATDWPESDPRFWVAYELKSVALHHRARVKVGLAGDDAHVPSVTDMFPTANWLERETWDLYGVVFDGHPDLTRILLPDDWEGHPLLKTEELGGVNTRFVGAYIPPVDKRTAT